ncbi:MAG: GNAT family N-acetyltransferase [Kiritimatiellia bacterium]
MSGIENTNRHAAELPGIRFLGPEDARELMRVRHRAIRECAVHFGTPVGVELQKNLEHYRRQLLRYRSRGEAALLGGWLDGRLVGLTGIRVRTHLGCRVGLVYSTFVEAALRGQGLGGRLVRRAQTEIQNKWGLSHCLLNVEVSNTRALKLYQACGFEITGTQRGAFWIQGAPHDVFVLERKTV